MDTPRPEQIRTAQPEAERATDEDSLELMEMILGALGRDALGLGSSIEHPKDSAEWKGMAVRSAVPGGRGEGGRCSNCLAGAWRLAVFFALLAHSPDGLVCQQAGSPGWRPEASAAVQCTHHRSVRPGSAWHVATVSN